MRTLCTRAFVTPMYISRVSSLLSNSALRRNLTNQLRPPDDNPALWHNRDVMAHESNNWLPASPGRALSPLLRESVDPLNRRTVRNPRRARSQRSWFKGLYSRQDRKELSSVPSHQWFPLWRLTALYKAEQSQWSCLFRYPTILELVSLAYEHNNKPGRAHILTLCSH